jgi:Fe2+ transport system protein FeoA
MPGNWVSIIQQSPVTVVKIDHLELALEHDLAQKIEVEEVADDQ